MRRSFKQRQIEALQALKRMEALKTVSKMPRFEPLAEPAGRIFYLDLVYGPGWRVRLLRNWHGTRSTLY